MLKRIALAACTVLLAGNLFAAENPRVLLTTSLGEIELELEAEKAPISVENFLGYVDSGFMTAPCSIASFPVSWSRAAASAKA